MNDILVTGGTGQVGGYIAGRSRDGYHFAAPTRRDLDLGNRGSIFQAISARPWAAVINTAAYTAVDKAESDAPAAWRINADGPQWLAEATAARNIPLLHVSTDYVFSGNLDRPYEEDDETGPLSVYGASKEAGERRIREAHPRHAIVRTSWVISPRGENFVKTMLSIARERASISVVGDQHGSPTHAADLAQALMTMAVRLATDRDAATGTFHFTNEGFTTWAEIAQEVFRVAATKGGPRATVQLTDTASFPRPAARPRNSRLARGRLAASYGITRRPWSEAVAEIVEQIIHEGRS